MYKQIIGAALLCSALAAPVLAQKTPFSLGFSIASPGVIHPFENPPKPGSSSGNIGAYGGISKKDYDIKQYAVEGILQFSLPKAGHVRIRGGYSFRQTDFAGVYAAPDQTPAQRSRRRETAHTWQFAPGFVSSHSLGKFSLDAGVELPVYFMDRLESYSTWEDLQTPEGEIQENRIYFPGGTSFGIGPVAGFSYHPVRQISLGVELRSAWMYTRLKGNYEEEISWDGTVTKNTGTAESYRNSSMSNLQVALQLRFSL